MQAAACWETSLRCPLREVVAESVFRSRPAGSSNDVGQVPLGHCVTGSLQLGRHRNVNVQASVYALDANAAVLDVLRTETNDLAPARGGLKREFHDEPLLRPKRPKCPILFDLVIGPGVVPLRL